MPYPRRRQPGEPAAQAPGRRPPQPARGGGIRVEHALSRA
ncbi:GntR family transcriptional regulator, partial [Streptomyces albidoflavus]